MKILSEKTNKYYNSVDECLKAEEEYDNKIKREEEKLKKLNEKQNARYDEVDKAYKDLEKACEKYLSIRKKYIDDYGWHNCHRNGHRYCLDDFEDIFNTLLFL